jgi:hypothetical protein
MGGGQGRSPPTRSASGPSPAMMTAMAVDPKESAVQESREGEAEAQRQAAWMTQAAEEPEQQQEWIRQNSAVYGGLIAIGLVMVQQFLTAAGLDWSAKICVLAFAVAIPLLAALIMVNRQENFRRRATDSRLVRVAQSGAQALAFAGIVAGFWHIWWLAGVVILVSGFVALGVHSAGHFRLETAVRAAADSAVQK